MTTYGRLMEDYMIGVLTHHWAKPDKVEAAKKLLDGNGLAQSKAPGFVSRQTLYSLSDPTKITTLVVWDSNDIYDQWRASPERAAAMSGADALWLKSPESERFDVV
jgi:heme-degrading monooxygenase HmoA